MNRPRGFDLAALVLAVTVTLALCFALRPEVTATVTANPSTVHVDRQQLPAADARPSVLFIGDSYTGGSGLKEMSYACMAATRMGWLCNLSAQPGTGYISGGDANRFDIPGIGQSKSFAERIPLLAKAYHPDVVILDGGRNDLFPRPDRVFLAMAGTVGEARRAWPDATIVFIRPRFLASPGDDLGFDDSFFADLQAQPDVEGVTFIDPIVRLTGIDTSAMLKNDGIHPNQQGNQELSSALFDSLSTTGFAPSM